MNPTKRQFGSLLCEYRSLVGVTQADVAKAIGKSVAFVSDVERGARGPFHPNDIRRCARLFGDVEAELVKAAEADVLMRWRCRGGT